MLIIGVILFHTLFVYLFRASLTLIPTYIPSVGRIKVVSRRTLNVLPLFFKANRLHFFKTYLSKLIP